MPIKKDYKALQNGSDIRGVSMDVPGGKPVNLGVPQAADIAAGFAEWLSKRTGKSVCGLRIAVGRDSRLTGEELLDSFAGMLSSLGADVLDCSVSSTPAMFMSSVLEDFMTDGAVMITASHLPPERNGFKFFTRDGGLDKGDISRILEIAEKNEKKPSEGAPAARKADLMSAYCAHLRNIIRRGLGKEEDPAPLRGLHVVVDAGNGAGGFYAHSVLAPLGADISGSQFLEPDGNFPAHQPNPENPDAMESIRKAVTASGADLGLIFDTDVDRAAAVDERGRELARNGIVALASVIASEGHPGTTVVTDSITSTQLGEFLEDRLGLKHFRYKRGYRNVISKAIELNAQGIDCELAIETSGHAAMKENYFLDDGAYLAARIVVKAMQLKRAGKGISYLTEDLEEPEEAREIRFSVLSEDFADYAQEVLDFVEEAVKSGMLPGASLELPNYEGVRVNMDAEHGNGWFLIRKSLHDPVIPVNVESCSRGGAETILSALKKVLEKFTLLS